MATTTSPAPDVVVLGGGAIGLATAWRAAEAGLGVTVVDPAPAQGATWAAAGMLAPVTEVHYGEETLLRLNLASNARWPAFAEALVDAAGADIGYRQCGALMVARDRDDMEALDALYAFHQRLGLEVTRLRGREARESEPALAPRTRGGILVEGDHQVDNRALGWALLAACERAGATLVRERATGVTWAGDRVTGVVLERGEALAAGTTVVAAGAQTGTLAGLPACLQQVRPVKGQLLHLRTAPFDAGAPPLASRNLRGLEVYIVPRPDGRLVVGATVEERGADTTVTAGAVRDLLRAAWEILPGIDDLELTETVAGLRPCSPDNAPLLGPAGPEGLVAATGHFRNGVLLTPVTAETLTEVLTTGTVPDLIAPFAPGRFAQEPVG